MLHELTQLSAHHALKMQGKEAGLEENSEKTGYMPMFMSH